MIHVVDVGAPKVAWAVLLGDGMVRGVIDSRDGAGVRDLAVSVLKSFISQNYAITLQFPKDLNTGKVG